MTSPEAISQRDAAKRLGVSTATIERWVRRGQLNTIRTGKNHGARRVLTDDAFRAAATRPRKIHHRDSTAPEKSITRENPSRPDSDHPVTVDTTAEPTGDASDGFASRPNLPRQADPASAAAKSIAPTFAESLTTPATESLTPDDPEVRSDAPLEPSLKPASAVQTPSPQSAQNPSPLVERASSERRRSPISRPSDADLVPLTRNRPSTRHGDTAGLGTPGSSSGRLRIRVAACLVIVTFAATAALAISWPGHESRRPEISAQEPVARGAHATTIDAKPVLLRVQRVRGGLARAISSPPRGPTTDVQLPPTRQPRPAQTTPEPAAKRPEHRPPAITPCQSAGICVR